MSGNCETCSLFLQQPAESSNTNSTSSSLIICPSPAPSPCCIDDISPAQASPRGRLIICGDLNVRSREWDYTWETRDGIVLEDAVVLGNGQVDKLAGSAPLGPLILVQKLLPLIKQAASQGQPHELSCNKAAVVLVSSGLGSQTLAFEEEKHLLYDYRASKTALNMATVLLANELRPAGIYVTALHPGWTRTDMGTEKALLSKEESIEACLKALGQAGEDSHGKIVSYEGTIVPY